MKAPYGFDVSDDCPTCKLRHFSFFCAMKPQAIKDFDAIKSNAAYPQGALLFLEKQEPRGVFVICQGEVKLTMSSSEGKTLILRIAKAGEILGLMATLSGCGYEMTAETLHPSQIAYVRREDFLRFIAKHPEVHEGIIKQLSSNYLRACEQLRTVGLLASAPERLAKLLLEWSADAEETNQGKRITMPLTHEEIAECIGSCRETVTRTLSDFKSRNVVKLKGSSLFISDRAALESFVTG
jgi:CRP/FNR family cyclic AMP-dependent transcriptional regulator